MAYKVIITSGGLKEPIDAVRFISNTSTGQLGAMIAEEFAEAGAEVTYIHAKGAILPPENGNISLIQVQSVTDLKGVITSLLTENTYNGFIHAMAVSDYYVQSVLPYSEAVNSLPQGIEQLPKADYTRKLSSSEKNPVLVLAQTPKIIDEIKTLAPDITLIGFKLQSGVSTQQLHQAAREILGRTNADYILANRLEDIDETISDTNTFGQHLGYLVSKHRVELAGKTKHEIAQALYNVLLV